MASHAIEVKNLYKIFGPRGEDYVKLVENGMGKAELNEKHGHVLGLQDINISMPGGCITVVMGLSGSGKSTLIRHINRLIDPTSGEVLYDGVDVCKMNENDLRAFRRHKTAMVFQKFALLPHRTVLENTIYGLEIKAWTGARARSVRLAGSSASAFKASKSTIRTSFPAACSSASALPAHLQTTPTYC